MAEEGSGNGINAYFCKNLSEALVDMKHDRIQRGTYTPKQVSEITLWFSDDPNFLYEKMISLHCLTTSFSEMPTLFYKFFLKPKKFTNVDDEYWNIQPFVFCLYINIVLIRQTSISVVTTNLFLSFICSLSAVSWLELSPEFFTSSDNCNSCLSSKCPRWWCLQWHEQQLFSVNISWANGSVLHVTKQPGKITYSDF